MDTEGSIPFFSYCGPGYRGPIPWSHQPNTYILLKGWHYAYEGSHKTPEALMQRSWIDSFNNLKSIDSKIRSSIGFSLYWSTPIGPLQFNWAKPQQYESGVDKTENFSFNIASQF